VAEPKRARAEAALDDVSDHLGIVLQRADELLAQWSAFGASVRGQVEREAAAVGEAVAGAVDTAVARATASGIDRAITDQVGSRLTALAAEIARLEARTRAAARGIADQRTGDRRLLWVVIGGIVLANALLVAILLRRPAAAPAYAEPTKVELAVPPAAGAVPAAGSGAGPGGFEEPQADAPSSNEPLKAPPGPVKENAPRPEPSRPVSGARPVGAPAGGVGVAAPAPAGGAGVAAPVPAVAGPTANGVPAATGSAAAGAPVQVLGASAGVRVPASAKLPPRAAPPKR
jgi:hypothetical protein